MLQQAPREDVTIEDKIKIKAKELGFDLVGISPALPTPDFDLFKDWLEKGYAAELEYLYRNTEKRQNPQNILGGAQSIISIALNYYSQDKIAYDKSHQGNISNYAWGKDYHKMMTKRLKRLAKWIESDFPAKTKFYVDTGPILERSYAQKAGLGWIGKNTCLINRSYGSWIFLGEIITDLNLKPDSEESDHCGTCTRCIDACPTDALVGGRNLDANRCIAYLTIEKRGLIPENFRSEIGNHLAGCDICQDVCPWNARPIQTGYPEFFPRENRMNPDLDQLTKMNEDEFQNTFLASPIKRLKHQGMIRNAVIAMGNSKNKKFIEALNTLQEKSNDPIILDHVVWAIREICESNFSKKQR